jgi:hypothetical protein
MVHIPHDPQQDQQPSWWKEAGGYVSIRCAQCGQRATLRDPDDAPLRVDGTRGHTISSDGTVAPSIVCPYKPCTWHIWGKLLDWVA